MNKQEWKQFYRAIRVTRREANKVAMDMMLYGSGAIFIPDNGDDPKHVPLKDIYVSTI